MWRDASSESPECTLEWLRRMKTGPMATPAADYLPITGAWARMCGPNPADPIWFHKTRERYPAYPSAVADKVEVQTNETKEETRGQAPNQPD